MLRYNLALCGVHIALSYCAGQQPFDLDPSFQTAMWTGAAGGPTTNVQSIAPLPDGGILCSGAIRFPGDTSPRGVVKLDAQGAWVNSYPAGIWGGGKITEWSGRYYIKSSEIVRRIWPDGSYDTTFINMMDGPYFSSLYAADYHVYGDGRILMVGDYLLLDSIRGYVGDHCLGWFSNEGYLDTTAQHRTCNWQITRIEPQADGKFICGGPCTIYDGSPVHRIFRLLPDGALDTTFATDFVWGSANDFTVLGDGRIIASGYLQRDGLPDTLRIVRLLTDGTLDPTFNNDLTAPDSQFALSGMQGLFHTVLDDGRIILHGNFDSIDGEPRVGIAMLDADGYVSDDHFTGGGCGDYDPGVGLVSHSTNGMTQAADGSWYIHGSYHGYDDGTTNDPGQRMVSRLYGLDVGVEEQVAVGSSQLAVSPNPAIGLVQVVFGQAPSTALLVLRNALGRTLFTRAITGRQMDLDVRGLAPGVYVLALEDDGRRMATTRLVVASP